ncbi:MAG: hypothetical protein LBB89_11595 [Treponema sp.]|jgi:hypothetical protein|nr:hypothetical protein [Treponema sp.]
MTNKDKGQFLAEIKMIGKQKEFSGLFGEKINPLNLVKKVDGILDTRKTSYNYAFVKCCEKNGLTGIDNIHNDLEKIWSDCKIEFNAIKHILLPSIAVQFGILGLLLSRRGIVGKYQDRISEKWLQYIQKTIDYAGTLDDTES